MNGSVFKRCPCPTPGKDTAGKKKTCKKDHGSWYFGHDLPALPGVAKRPRVRRGGFTTKELAEQALATSLASCIQRGLAAERDRAAGRQRLADYLTAWVEGKTSLKPTTRHSYRMHIDNHLIPHLGHLRLEELGASHIEQMYAKLRKPRRRKAKPPRRKPGRPSRKDALAPPAPPTPGQEWRLTPASIQRIHATLRKALNDAVRRHLITDNPARFVELESVRYPRASYWNSDQAGTFLDAIVDDRLYALYHLAVYRGLRRGEIIALRWEDLDLDQGLCDICRNLVQVGRTTSEGTPKSQSSERHISLDDDTIAVLKAHRELQQQEREEHGTGYADHDLVFCKENGEPLYPEYVSRHLTVLIKRVGGLPMVTFHELRHTAASLMLEAGAELKYIQYVLGHSNLNITGKLYTHIVRRLDQRRSGQVAGIIPRKRLLPGRSSPGSQDQAAS